MTVGEEIVFVGDSDLLLDAGTTDCLAVWPFRPFNCRKDRIAFWVALLYELSAAASGGSYVAHTKSYEGIATARCGRMWPKKSIWNDAVWSRG